MVSSFVIWWMLILLIIWIRMIFLSVMFVVILVWFVCCFIRVFVLVFWKVMVVI